MDKENSYHATNSIKGAPTAATAAVGQPQPRTGLNNNNNNDSNDSNTVWVPAEYADRLRQLIAQHQQGAGRGGAGGLGEDQFFYLQQPQSTKQQQQQPQPRAGQIPISLQPPLQQTGQVTLFVSRVALPRFINPKQKPRFTAVNVPANLLSQSPRQQQLQMHQQALLSKSLQALQIHKPPFLVVDGVLHMAQEASIPLCVVLPSLSLSLIATAAGN